MGFLNSIKDIFTPEAQKKKASQVGEHTPVQAAVVKLEAPDFQLRSVEEQARLDMEASWNKAVDMGLTRQFGKGEGAFVIIKEPQLFDEASQYEPNYQAEMTSFIIRDSEGNYRRVSVKTGEKVNGQEHTSQELEQNKKDLAEVTRMITTFEDREIQRPSKTVRKDRDQVCFKAVDAVTKQELVMRAPVIPMNGESTDILKMFVRKAQEAEEKKQLDKVRRKVNTYA